MFALFRFFIRFIQNTLTNDRLSERAIFLRFVGCFVPLGSSFTCYDLLWFMS